MILRDQLSRIVFLQPRTYMKAVLLLSFCVGSGFPAVTADAPPAEAFQVLPSVTAAAPIITPYL
ncbi:MAG TPA: hypothetical protein VKG87_12255, partial [Terriglobales bacterium]|nr:hypothetical protein [Terriglobales bacterium]